MLKKTLSVLLAVVILCGIVPMSVTQVFAAQTDSNPVADGDASYPVLNIGSVTTAVFTEGGVSEIIYQVNPTESGVYSFYSTGDNDTIAELFDDSWNSLAENDDFDGNNFGFTQALEADKTYFLKLWLYNYYYDDDGKISVELHADKQISADSITITQGDTLEGYEWTEARISYTLSPAEAYQEEPVWSSSDNDTASVYYSNSEESYMVKLIKPGTAVITAKLASGAEDSISVTVKEAETLTLDQAKQAAVNENNDMAVFKFTAPETRVYAFYSTGDYNTYGRLCDSDGDRLESSGYGGEGLNFRVEYKLEKDKTYYLSSNLYENYYGETVYYDVYVTAVPYAESLEITNDDPIYGYPGGKVNLDYTFLPKDCADEDVAFTSSDPDIVNIQYNDELEFLKPGTATITATSENGLTDTVAVTVKDFEPITLDAPETVTTAGFNYKVFKFVPSETGTYVFTSSDTDYQAYGEIGEIEDESCGEQLRYQYGNDDFSINCKLEAGKAYYLKAGYGGIACYGTYQVTLTKLSNASSLEIVEGESVSGSVGDRIYLNTKFLPAGSEEEDVSWESSDTDIVSVGYYGSIYLNAEGEATVTATSESGLTDSIKVTVTGAEDIEAGETKTAEITASGASVLYKFIPDETSQYTFCSSGDYDTYGYLYDSDMYEITNDDDSGEDYNFTISATLTKGETYYFRANLNEYGNIKTGTFTVSLIKRSKATAIAINQGDTYTGKIGTSKKLKVVYTPEGAIEEDIEWSSDSDCVSVDNDGNISLDKIGSAVITAESENGLTATCTVTVEDLDEIKLNEKKAVTLNSPEEDATYKFIPAATGDYFFESLGDCSTYGRILDENMNILTSGSWGGSGDGFKLRYTLEKDKTYYMQAALDYGDEGSFELLVSPVPTAESISITARTLTGMVGGEINMGVEFDPEDSASEEVTWTSSNEAVATVNEYGKVSLIKEGKADITATTPSGLTDKVTVRVTSSETIAVNDTKTVTVSESGEQKIFKFVPGETAQYAFYSPGESGGQYGSLCTGNMSPLYTTIGGNIQIIRTLSEGETYYYICGLTEDHTGTYDVTLIKCGAAESITINPSDNISGYIGYSTYLSVDFHPEFSVSESISWSSGDNSIAQVSDDGMLTFKKIGTTTITAESENGLTASATVTVKDYEPLKAGDVKNVEITTKGGYEFYVITPDEDGAYVFQTRSGVDTFGELYDSDFDLITSNDDGGQDNNFRIQSILEGGKTYYLKARLYSTQKTGSFTVTADTVPFAESMTIRQGNAIKAYPNTYVDLQAVFDPQECYSESIRWSSSDDSVADVDNYGSVKINSIGTATITAESERGLKATCTVNVVDYETLNAGDTKTADITYEGGRTVYKVIPDKDCRFEFTGSSKNTVELSLKDESFDEISMASSSNKASLRYNLEKGKTYYLAVGFRNFEATGPVTVTAEEIVGVTDLTITSLPTQTTYVDGFQTDYDYEGLALKATWSDGEVTEWTYGDSDYMRGEYVHFMENEPTVTVECGGSSASFDLEFIENPVNSIEIVDGLTSPIVEHTHGYWDTRTDTDTGETSEIFVYNMPNTTNVTAKINYKDGTSKTVKLSDKVDGYEFDCDTDQYKTPWTVGSSNAIEVSYLGKTTNLYVTVTESPVESLEVLDGFTLTVIEEADGYYTTVYNPETGNYDREIFRYDCNGVQKANIQVNYKDGTTKIVHPYDTVDGEDVIVSTDQNKSPWTVGGENPITIEYMGATTTITGVIAPNPVESISIAKPTTKVFIENSDGYTTTGNNNEPYFYYYTDGIDDTVVQINYKDGTSTTANLYASVNGYRISSYSNQYDSPWTVGGENIVTVEYMGREVNMPVTVQPSPLESLVINQAPTRVYIYGDSMFGTGLYFMPDDISGLRFTANFKDGTSKTYTSADLDKNGKFDGHRYEIKINGAQKVGDNPVTFSYMGKEATYNVPVTENTTASVEVVKLPTKPEYSQYYSPDWRGMQVKVTKTDGTSKTITLNDSNIVYGFDDYYGYHIAFDLDGHTGRITSRNNQNDEIEYFVDYLGKTCTVDGLTYRKDKEVVDVEVENFSMSAENMIVKITNADGSKEQIVLDNIVDNRIGWMPEFYYVRALTSKGLLSFMIFNPEVLPDYENKMMIFGIYVKKDAEPEPEPTPVIGDVNNDGVVDILDAAVIQKYAAGKSNLTEKQLAVGDVNNDNSVDILDATQIQKFAAGKIDHFKRTTIA